VARRIVFDSLGRGLNTNGVRGPAGFARVSRNLQHNRGDRAVLRGGTRRVWATLTEAPVQFIFEYFNASGTAFRLCQANDELESFSLTAATAKTNLVTLNSTGRSDITEAVDFAIIANARGKNYISKGDAVQEIQVVAAPSAPSLTENGTAVGFGTGTFRVATSYYNPTYDMESPPSTATTITKVSVDLGIRFTTPADPSTTGYTTVRVYRTKVNTTGPFFRCLSTTDFNTSKDLTAIDADLGFSTTAQSDLHSDDGSIVGVKPAAAKFCCWHKGHLHFYSESSHLIRDYWSDLNRPTQFRTYSIAQSPPAYHDMENGQGRIATGLNSFNGSLVNFKDYSITVKNGDVDPASWVWYVAVDGIGCVAPWTRAVAPNIGVFFCGHDGVYLFDLNAVTKISDKPNGTGIGDDYRALDFSKVEKWWGVWDETTRQYLLGVTTTTGTYPDRVYTYAFDTGAWGTIELGMGLLYSTCAGIVTNASSQRRVYLGLSDGHALETGLGASLLRDGPISGTVTGTAAAGSDASNIVGTGFYATGNSSTGLVATVRHSATSYESRLVTSVTSSTTLTFSTPFSSTTLGKTFWVGAIQGTLALEQYDGDTTAPKQFHETGVSWGKQTHTTPMRVGFTLDDDTPPTYAGDERNLLDIRGAVPVGDRGVQIGPYFDLIGTDAPFEISLVEVFWSAFGTRRPGN
jgi:hypothetical protein